MSYHYTEYIGCDAVNCTARIALEKDGVDKWLRLLHAHDNGWLFETEYTLCPDHAKIASVKAMK